MPTRFLSAACAVVLTALSPAPAIAGEAVASGVFTGQSGHKTSGTVAVYNTAKGYTVELGPDSNGAN